MSGRAPRPDQVLAYALADLRQRRRLLARLGPSRATAREAARRKLALAEAQYATLSAALTGGRKASPPAPEARS